MATYRTPLPGLLASALEISINQVLAMDEHSSQRLGQLDQRLVRLQLEGLGITLDFAFTPQRVHVGLETEEEPDTVINGTPAALFAMAIPDETGSWGSPGSRVRISGDATLARDLERLFSRLDPDWEGRLSNLFGEVVGHQLARGARTAGEQFRSTISTLGDITSDFLTRPSSPLAQEDELREFGKSVDTARDTTERLEARLRILQERAASPSSKQDSKP